MTRNELHRKYKLKIAATSEAVGDADNSLGLKDKTLILAILSLVDVHNEWSNQLSKDLNEINKTLLLTKEAMIHKHP